jgi:DNA-binding NtrC family response regulator
VVALGSTKPVKVDVRVVAATHQDLPERVAAGRFRDDLYARLKGEVLTLPPLRGRREDMGLLCTELLPRVAGARAAAITFQREAARALLQHDWPHNIRELEHVLARALALLDHDELRLEHLPLGRPRESVAQEREQLRELVLSHRGNVSAMARALGTSRSQVRRLLARHDLDLPRAAPPDDDSAD